MSEDKDYFSPHAIDERTQVRREKTEDGKSRAIMDYYDKQFGGLKEERPVDLSNSPHSLQDRADARRQEKSNNPIKAAVGYYEKVFGRIGRKD